ncbi:MAG: hypothetical protein KDC56_06245, partial [Flavobacteriaceae bacterium]|nr:hypothetical protein [Flavobacteriaceae bacterium]
MYENSNIHPKHDKHTTTGGLTGVGINATARNCRFDWVILSLDSRARVQKLNIVKILLLGS